MKTLTNWLLGLALPMLALAPACDDGNDGNSDGCDGGNDDGNDDGSSDGDGDDGTPPGDDGTPPADDGTPPGDDGTPPAGGEVGDQCMADDDCADDACIFAGDADYGFCSKVCDSFADCPAFWDCGPVGNASADYCLPPE